MAEVFVVDRAAFFGGRWPQGFLPLDAAAGVAFVDRCHQLGRFEPRPMAEVTPAWKQWIPYCVLRGVDPSSPDRHNPSIHSIFQVRRSKGQSEARLHGLWSIGLGGHIEPEDQAPMARGAEFFAAALRRELDEELHLRVPPACQPRLVGLLNDDGTEVGRVHAGLVYVLDVPLPAAQARDAVSIREISKMSGGFGSLVDFRILWQDRLQFETWSQILVDAGIAGPMGASANTDL
jgi:predicted NUDIX family phosphoesterase